MELRSSEVEFQNDSASPDSTHNILLELIHDGAFLHFPEFHAERIISPFWSDSDLVQSCMLNAHHKASKDDK